MSSDRADALWSELEQAYEDWRRLSGEFWALREERVGLLFDFIVKERSLFERVCDTQIRALSLAQRYRVAQFNARLAKAGER